MPLQLYFVDGRAKVEIGVARGKKEYDKRQTLREQQDKREALRVMRERTWPDPRRLEAGGNESGEAVRYGLVVREGSAGT